MRDVVALHVETPDPTVSDAIEARILANLRDRFGDFWRNRELQLYALRVVIQPVGSLRGQGRKLRRLVDERPMAADRVTLAR